jgi:hypothetical protein
MRNEGGDASDFLTSHCEDLQANHIGTKMYPMLNGKILWIWKLGSQSYWSEDQSTILTLWILGKSSVMHLHWNILSASYLSR